MSAYLLVYFSDSDHSVHFAVSRDGYSFKALNDNRPVIAGDTLSDQRGIRDPHIYRGPDGNFYMVATDLHIYAMKHGIRETEWERPDEYGWGNNRGLVLMKSSDLINWTHNETRLDKLFPDDFGDIGCAWAPQTIYDPDKDAMMVYFTIRKKGEHIKEATKDERKTRLYYSYANNDFTELATKPEKLYDYPDEDIQVLDADISPTPDSRYAMTYVAQEHPGGIKIAFSEKINSCYDYLPGQIDGEPKSCEAPNVWKRIGENRWVVMYDIFSIDPHNFGFVETTDFKTFIPIGRFNDGPMKSVNFNSPKHGSVIHITAEEADRLEQHFPSTL